MVKSVVLPASWHQEQLKDLCLYPGEYGLNSPAIPLSPDLPLYIRITDIDDDGRYLLQHRATVIYSGKQKLLQKNDLLFARTGATVGKTYLHQDTSYPTAFAGYLIRFVPNTAKIIPYFLFLYCHTAYYWNWIKIFKARSGQPGISADEYGKMLVPCPPIAEQQKIVEVLETWDKAIQLTRKLIEQKELQKKYLMQQLLTDKNIQNIESKPSFYRINEFLNEENHKSTLNDQYPVLSVTKKGICLQSEYFDKQIASEDNIGYKILTKKKIVFSPMNLWMGAIGFSEQQTGIVSPAYKIFSVNERIALFDFLKYYMKTPRMLYLYSINSEIGASIVRRNLDLNGLLHSKILLPHTEKQKEFSDILSLADKEIELLHQKLVKLEEQKKGLMQVLLTGKIRLK